MADAPSAEADSPDRAIAGKYAILEAYYPVVHRIAFALCGDPASAAEVIERVIARALHALRTWRDDTAADRWFYHFTVLESRRHADTTPAGADTLIPPDHSDPAYKAFIRALRSLPTQQREALILTHGERLNPRYLSVAMDCSAQAAANHLREATQQLIPLTDGNLEPLLESLYQSYRTLSPGPQSARPLIRRHVNRHLLPRRLRRALLLILLCALACAAWRWSH